MASLGNSKVMSYITVRVREFCLLLLATVLGGSSGYAPSHVPQKVKSIILLMYCTVWCLEYSHAKIC